MKLVLSKGRLWAGGLIALLLTGCSLISSESSAPVVPSLEQYLNSNLLHDEAATLLSANQASFTAVLDSDKHVLIAQSAYFSASNKLCRNIRLSTSEQTEGRVYIACQLANDQWQLSRPLP